MKSRKVAAGYLVRLDKGEEAISSLTSFIAKKKVPCGTILGIGAIDNITIGYFDLSRHTYRKKNIKKVMEVVSLSGNISYLDGKPFVHTHIILAGPDHKTLGGHFFSGTVAITLEIYIHVIPAKLRRVYDKKVGFNFWDLSSR